MPASIPAHMKAAAFDRYGGPEVLHTETLPVPRPGRDQVLVRLDSAGIGVWDPFVRSGEVELGPSTFPRVIGNDGAGEVVAAGDRVQRVSVGDRVYAIPSRAASTRSTSRSPSGRSRPSRAGSARSRPVRWAPTA
jgi:NADPH:quinone reductase-like Zn-dependent oxidoreductase